MEREEIKELTNIEIYQAFSSDNNFSGYMFSIQDTDCTEEMGYRYYIVSLDHDNNPLIRRVNNTITLLSSGQIVLNRINTESDEITKFLQLISSFERKMGKKDQFSKQEQPSSFFSSVNENDIKLLTKN